MTLEQGIETLAWIITAVLLWLFIPRNKIREAHVIFFFKQLITWPIGLLVAEFRLIEYPSRLLSKATTTSFAFEYFVYPAFSVFFNLYYPEKGGWAKKAAHYFSYTSGITLVEVIIEKHTKLIDYIHWYWYWTWITLFVTFAISRMYYKWFFKPAVP